MSEITSRLRTESSRLCSQQVAPAHDKLCSTLHLTVCGDLVLQPI